MIKKILKRRRVVIIAMLIALFGTVCFGLFALVKTSARAITDMSTNKIGKLAADVDGICGSVFDSNGEVLWSENESGHESTYSIVGDIRAIFIENTITVHNENKLVDVSAYNIFEGIKSMENTGNNIYLTLDLDLNNDIYEYMLNNGVVNGSALFVDADTGAIKAAVSLPSWDPDLSSEEMKEGALVNKNISTTIPGSTMKIITSLLLIKEFPGIANITYECTGSYVLANGAQINCHDVHGSQNLISAIGVSCNCYYAQAISAVLDNNPNATVSRLRDLGFMAMGTENKKIQLDESGVMRVSSSLAYDGSGSFDSVWSLIGEGSVQVSPIDMCHILRAIVNGGQANESYLMDRICEKSGKTLLAHDGVTEEVVDADTANTLYGYWKDAFENYYGNEYHDSITVAKTGTAEYDNEKNNSKLLMGYMEDKNVCFFIEIVDYQGGILPADVANFVAER